jgi:hypothetical protein
MKDPRQAIRHNPDTVAPTLCLKRKVIIKAAKQRAADARITLRETISKCAASSPSE